MNLIDKAIGTISNPISLGPVDMSTIREAEKALNLTFSEDYVHYLHKYGCISARGIDLTGICQNKYQHVVSTTQREKELNPLIPQNQYVIESLGIGGIIMLQDNTGAIYITAYNRAPYKIHNSLSEYIEARKVQYEEGKK